MRRLPKEAIDVLSAHVPQDDLRRMSIITGPPGGWIPAVLRTGAVTVGSWVFIRPDRFNPGTARGLALIAHEAGHVGQYRELGAVRFLLRYLRLQLKAHFDHDRHLMEVPCIELQRRVRLALRERGWP